MEIIKCFILLIKVGFRKHKWVGVFVSATILVSATGMMRSTGLDPEWYKKCQIRSGDVGFVVRDKIRRCQRDCTVNGGLDKILLVHS